MTVTKKMTKKYLVFGGSGYIGSEVCKLLATDQEAEIFFTYFSNKQKAQELEKELPNLKGYFLDLKDENAIRNLLQEIIKETNELDGFAQCAGTPGEPASYQEDNFSFTEISSEHWEKMLNLTLKSTFIACQEIAKKIKQGGNIVFVGAMVGVKSVPAPLHYAVSKGSLRTLAATLSKEIGSDNICINMIAPGILEGGIGSLLKKDLQEEYKRHCSLSRLGTGKEIAEVLNWFLTENTYVTGQSILLDGGL